MSRRTAAAWVALFVSLTLVSIGVIDTGGDDRPDSRDKQSSMSADQDGRIGDNPAVAPPKTRTANVVRVVDGDTIIVRGAGGRYERVRYIGVDTPESVKPNTPPECYGKLAGKFNKALVAGRTVRLRFDQERTDKYDRTLAYVYSGNLFVNAELVKNGYARTLEIEPNTAKAEELAKLERVAIRTNKGLWGSCDR